MAEVEGVKQICDGIPKETRIAEFSAFHGYGGYSTFVDCAPWWPVSYMRSDMCAGCSFGLLYENDVGNVYT